jgi:multidrug resistance efflux pump
MMNDYISDSTVITILGIIFTSGSLYFQIKTAIKTIDEQDNKINKLFSKLDKLNQEVTEAKTAYIKDYHQLNTDIHKLQEIEMDKFASKEECDKKVDKEIFVTHMQRIEKEYELIKELLFEQKDSINKILKK